MPFNTITNQEKIELVKNLTVMLKSAIPIDEALQSLAEQAKSKKLKNIITNIKLDAQKGISLATAFQNEQKHFGNIFTSLVRAGDTSGTLEENLTFLGNWLERNEDLDKEIKNALLYPKIVLIATFLLGGGLTVFVLPRLVPMFTSLHVKLPLVTRILFAISMFIQQYWYFVAFAFAGFIALVMFLNTIVSIRRMFHWWYLRMPIFGPIIIDYQLALISQILFTLFKSGIPIDEALRITAEGATNTQYKESLRAIIERVMQGVSFGEAMKSYPKLYPTNMMNIISVGEKSGTLEDSFLYLSEFYSKEVSGKTKRLPVMIEPLLLIVIGLVVGFVALAIIAPMYEITSGLK